MPPKRRNKRVPKDMSHITSDPSKCGLHHWGTKLEAAFPPQVQGASVPELGPATGPAHGQELTLSFSVTTDELSLNQGSQPKNVHKHPSTTPQPQALSATSFSQPLPSTPVTSRNLPPHAITTLTSSRAIPDTTFLALSPAAMKAGNVHSQLITTPPSSQTQTQSLLNPSLCPSSNASHGSPMRYHYGTAPNLEGQHGTDNRYYSPSPLSSSETSLQIPYTSPATSSHLSPGFGMSSLRLSNSPSNSDAFHSFHSSGISGTLNLPGGTDSSELCLSPSHAEIPSVEFNSDDVLLLFPDPPTRYLEASPNVAMHPIHSSNVGHSLEAASEDSSHRSLRAYPSSMTGEHLSPLSYSPMDDGSNQRFGSPSRFESSLSKSTPSIRPSNVGYSSMQMSATDESPSFGSHASNIAYVSSIPNNRTLDVPNNLGNDAHGVSCLAVMDRRRQRSHLASSSLPLPPPLPPPDASDSLSSVAHSRGAHSRRRTYPYRRPARNVRSSTGNTVPHPTSGLPLMREIHDNSSFGLQIPDPMVPPNLATSTCLGPSYDVPNNSAWGTDISRPSGSRPHLNLVPRVMRTSLRSSHPQQPSHNHATNSSEFYDTNALQLENINDQSQLQYDFYFPYPGIGGAGWSHYG